MNCYNHPDREAVATCTDCGKGLCQECASHWTIPLCDGCNFNRWSNQASAAKKELIYMAVCGVVCAVLFTVLVGQFQFLKFLGLIVGFAGVYAGWQCLNKITSKVFLILPIVGWFFYFMVKLMLSALICYPALAWRLYKDIKNLRQANAMLLEVSNVHNSMS